jgi:hypothetical protein
MSSRWEIQPNKTHVVSDPVDTTSLITWGRRKKARAKKETMFRREEPYRVDKVIARVPRTPNDVEVVLETWV